jgi:hypothetical protein
MKAKFLDFDILVTRNEQGYRAQALRAPAGGDVGQLRWPAKAVLRDLEGPEAGGLAAFREPTRSDARAVRDLLGSLERIGVLQNLAVTVRVGTVLFAALFRDAIKDRLRDSLALAQKSRAGLSIRLHLSAAPELARLPWECLYDPDSQQFLALTDRVQVVRTQALRYRGRSRPLRRNLRILAVVANPLHDLQVGREREILASIRQRSGGRIEVEILAEPSFAGLAAALRERSFDILYFAGHGRFRPGGQGGDLLFEVEGRPDPVHATNLAPILRNHPSLKLVVLNACSGGHSDQFGLLPGVAQALMLHGVPAVVAMQTLISDDAAISFAAGFQAGLSDTRSIEHAMARGREAILTVSPAEWAIPCLFTREVDEETEPRTLLLAMAATVLLCVTLLVLCLGHRPCHTLAISFPGDHAEVGPTETIEGSSCRLPPAQEIWIVVYSPEDQLYFPNRFKAAVQADGRWNARDTKIGGKNDRGKDFEVIVALADASGGLRLSAATDGIYNLPPGVRIFQRIAVTRRRERRGDVQKKRSEPWNVDRYMCYQSS